MHSFFPGGYGTHNEFFEAMTLIQTGKFNIFHIVLMVIRYWQPVVEFINTTLVKNKTISPEDAKLFHVFDDSNDAVNAIRYISMQQFGLTYQARRRKKTN